MNKILLNGKLKNISNMIFEINEKISKIKELNSEIELKEKRNKDTFMENENFFKKQINSIKSLYDNKYFDFFIDDDFNTDYHIENVDGFYFNERIGAMMPDVSDTVFYDYKSKNISGDQKSVVFNFENAGFINCLEYKFFNENSMPCYPKEIEYENFEGKKFKISESFFRFFNRNIETDFITELSFYPRDIKNITFLFEEKIRNENCFCKAVSKRYSQSGSFTWACIIHKKKNMLNVFKNSESSSNEINVQWSKDNINFINLEFKNSKGEIYSSFEPGDKLYLKFANSSESEKSVILNKYIVSDNSVAIRKDDTKYQLSNILNGDKLKIALNYSTYKKIKEILLFENIDFNFNELFYNENNVYYFHGKFVKFTDSINELEKNSLDTFDSVEALNEKLDFLKFVYDYSSNSLYCSNFMKEFSFKIEYETVSEVGYKDNSYFPSFVFNLSIKG